MRKKKENLSINDINVECDVNDIVDRICSLKSEFAHNTFVVLGDIIMLDRREYCDNVDSFLARFNEISSNLKKVSDEFPKNKKDGSLNKRRVVELAVCQNSVLYDGKYPYWEHWTIRAKAKSNTTIRVFLHKRSD